MFAKLLRVLFYIIGVVLGLVIILGVVGIFLARSSFPQVSGEVNINGLEYPVDIFRDSYGIPNIYAQNTHDLFFAQGYAPRGFHFINILDKSKVR